MNSGELVELTANVEILSGDTVITGTKHLPGLADDPPDASTGICEAFDPPLDVAGYGDDLAAFYRITARVRYEATISSPTETVNDSGTGFLGAVVKPLNVEGQTSEFGAFNERFISDLLPPSFPTAKEECRDGGFEAFGFENQGDRVSFVATGSRNEPGKNKPE